MDTPSQLAPEETALELTVIIPARNEQQNLPACLASILSQSEPGFALGLQWEVILVDDASTDDTPRIAAEAASSHPGVTVFTAPPLDLSVRSGFTGKNAACWLAAQQARGSWLLFTDADTLHETNDLSRSIREAERHHAALLSYSPRQIVTGFWQRTVMPLVFSELASVYPPQKVNDPGDRLAAANGQFLLVQREPYFATGGHRAIGPNILEDVALARNVKRGKNNIRLRYAPEAVAARMYPTTAAMIEGWTKNLALLMPSPIALALWRILDLLLFFGLPICAVTVPIKIPFQWLVFLLLWVRTIFRYYNRTARSNFPFIDVLLSILGIPLFAYLLIRSTIAHRFTKSVTWKGRQYRSTP